MRRNSFSGACRTAACLLFAALIACSGVHSVKHTFYRMDTIIEATVVVNRNDPAEEETLRRRLDSLFSSWERRFSQTHPESEILRINTRTSPRMPLSPDLERMIGYALRYGDTLSGGFDLTIFPVKRLWGLGEQDTALRVPSGPELDSVLRFVSYKKVRLSTNRDSVFFDDPRVAVDAGGLAKGGALAAAAKLLTEIGYKHFLLNGGGDIFSSGKRFDGASWLIGIQHPRAPGLLASLRLDSGCIFTSGDYERFYLRDGKRYHHLFDPRTGRSATRNQSLTVWSMDPMEAKAFSTGLFRLPPDSIVSFMNMRPRAECVVVDSAGRVSASDGWKQRITWK